MESNCTSTIRTLAWVVLVLAGTAITVTQYVESRQAMAASGPALPGPATTERIGEGAGCKPGADAPSACRARRVG